MWMLNETENDDEFGSVVCEEQFSFCFKVKQIDLYSLIYSNCQLKYIILTLQNHWALFNKYKLFHK